MLLVWDVFGGWQGGVWVELGQVDLFTQKGEMQSEVGVDLVLLYIRPCLSTELPR